MKKILHEPVASKHYEKHASKGKRSKHLVNVVYKRFAVKIQIFVNTLFLEMHLSLWCFNSCL